MANAREIEKRITSFGKTKQITRTMELVATSRMKKTQDRLFAAKPYAEKMQDILSSVNLEEHSEAFPLLQSREKVCRSGLLLITTNRGLCGGFNANLIRLARQKMDELKAAGTEFELHVVGKKGSNALRYLGYEIVTARTDIGDYPSYEEGAEIAAMFIEKFVKGTIDELHMVYAEFRNVASQPAAIETVLPLQVEEEGGGDGPQAEFILEPSPAEILENLLPRIVENRIFKALLESAAGEQAARRVAMKNATDNAEELIRLLTRSYNRARQAQITQELAEIVGGAEALA